MFFLLRSKRWVINLRREDLMKYSTEQLYAQYTVCANHFEDSPFMNPAQKNRPIHNAVPTLIAQHNAPLKLTPKWQPCKHQSMMNCLHMSSSERKLKKEAGYLVYPTIAMVQFLENLENVFCVIFEGIVHMPFILTWLCKSADKHCQFLTYSDIKCKLRVQNMVKLYMKVHILHALKCSNP